MSAPIAVGAFVASIISDLINSKANTKATRGRNQLLQQAQQGVQGKGPLAELFGPADIDQLREFFNAGIRQPAEKQFKEQTIPNIFQAFGSDQARGSDFQNALAQAASDFELGQESQFANFYLQDRANRAGNSSNLISRLLSTDETPQSSVFANTLSGIASGGSDLFLQQLLSGGEISSDLFFNKRKSKLTNPDNRDAQNG